MKPDHQVQITDNPLPYASGMSVCMKQKVDSRFDSSPSPL